MRVIIYSIATEITEGTGLNLLVTCAYHKLQVDFT